MYWFLLIKIFHASKYILGRLGKNQKQTTKFYKPVKCGDTTTTEQQKAITLNEQRLCPSLQVGSFLSSTFSSICCHLFL